MQYVIRHGKRIEVGELHNPRLPGAKIGRVADGDRMIGCPLWWFDLAFRAVRSKGELAVALYIYRWAVVSKRRTVKVTNRWLEVKGIQRYTKYRALARLAEAGIITAHQSGRAATEVTLLRRGRSRRVKH
jgi:hypothetical protein